jgi:hypothetical protein
MARRARKKPRGLTDKQQAAYYWARRDRRELATGGSTIGSDSFLLEEDIGFHYLLQEDEAFLLME